MYHGRLVFPSASAELQPGDGIIESASLIPFPLDSSGKFSPEDQPISMALTEHHFVLLYTDKICAVDILTDKVVYTEALELASPPTPSRRRSRFCLHAGSAGGWSDPETTLHGRAAQDVLDAYRDEHI